MQFLEHLVGNSELESTPAAARVNRYTGSFHFSDGLEGSWPDDREVSHGYHGDYCAVQPQPRDR